MGAVAAAIVLACDTACGGKKTDNGVGNADGGTCDDGVRSGAETDIDCGGPECAACPTDSNCDRHSDCNSLVCRAATCRAPSCDDAVRNGTETDTDCGGDCPPCDDGAACETASDCRSQVCASAQCQVPSCSDGLRNGDEVDIDCDGSCPPCISCFDAELNGGETDIDCGGACAPCALDQDCYVAEDCETGVCVGRDGGPTGNLCSKPHCGNGQVDENETDLDCGGPDCTPCSMGQTCQAQSDCGIGVCNGFCAQPCQDAALDCGTLATCENELCVYCHDASDCPPLMCGKDTPCVCKNGFCLH